jgi:hypothetical protein
MLINENHGFFCKILFCKIGFWTNIFVHFGKPNHFLCFEKYTILRTYVKIIEKNYMKYATTQSFYSGALGSEDIFEHIGFKPIEITRGSHCICTKVLHIYPFSDSKFGKHDIFSD